MWIESHKYSLLMSQISFHGLPRLEKSKQNLTTFKEEWPTWRTTVPDVSSLKQFSNVTGIATTMVVQQLGLSNKAVAGSIPGQSTIKSLNQLSLPSFQGQFEYQPYWLWLRWGAFACVGWQVTLCDPIWQVTPCSLPSGDFPLRTYHSFNLFSMCPHTCHSWGLNHVWAHCAAPKWHGHNFN